MKKRKKSFFPSKIPFNETNEAPLDCSYYPVNGRNCLGTGLWPYSSKQSVEDGERSEKKEKVSEENDTTICTLSTGGTKPNERSFAAWCFRLEDRTLHSQSSGFLSGFRSIDPNYLLIISVSVSTRFNTHATMIYRLSV